MLASVYHLKQLTLLHFFIAIRAFFLFFHLYLLCTLYTSLLPFQAHSFFAPLTSWTAPTSSAAIMTSIPLECICCPKKPKFSDVSHLLTHVASKGHLSHYYKLKVRSGSDQAARQTVDAFDQWYSDWNVEELMHDRLNLKDKKRARPRAAGTFHSHLPESTALLTWLSRAQSSIIKGIDSTIWSQSEC